MGRKERRRQIEDIFLQKEINLAVKKARARQEKRQKIQGFLDRPLFRTRPQKKGKRPRVNVQRGIKSLCDVI